jgi:putative acetyltransferase
MPPLNGRTDDATSIEPLRITPGGLDDPRVLALLEHHVRSARENSPPGTSFALDVSALRTPDIRFWTAWKGDVLVGIGALKLLETGHGEVKSMHTIAERRRSGIATTMLRHILDTARANGMSRVSLETGTGESYRGARELYRREGFVPCGPFGNYLETGHNYFMTLQLER